MEVPEEGTCSARALAAGEPLLGTASRVRSWLLVEQPGRWGHDGLTDSGLDRRVATALRDGGQRHGVRVLLIRRRDRSRPDRRRCFAAYTGVRERRLASFEVTDPAELLDLDLAGLARNRAVGVGEPVVGPLFLVCTHGKRDQCCALYGAPLARALAPLPGEQAWEATHIGGDRFAGNLVAFPHGLYFGRVEPEEAREVARSYAQGRIALHRYRGRSCYSPPVQAAEVFIRREFGPDGLDDLVPVRHIRMPGDVHEVSFRTPDGGVRTVTVRVSRAEPRRLTCKATHAHRPRWFTVLEPNER